MADTTQKLNTDTSIVDYLKSVGKDTSFNSRAILYGEGYTGTAEQNTSLLAKLKGGAQGGAGSGAPTAPTSPLAVTDGGKSAASFINGNQQQDFNLASTVENDVPVRGSSKTYADAFAELQKTLTQNQPTKPTATNFEQSYKDETSKAGINDLETQLNSLTDEENTIRAGFRQQKANEQGKTVAMNVIEGRVGEEERAANERLDAVLRQKDYITNQLKTKYDVVNNLMNLKKLDYETATDAYNTAFTQNLNMFNTVKGIMDADKSDQERKEDNARANAQIIYNNLTSGGITLDSIPADQKLQITKLEMQAGLPSGFFASLQSKNPKQDIVTSTTRTSGGKKYADVIMRGQDGALITKSILLGSTNEGSGGETESDLERGSRSKVTSFFKSVQGGDGYVSPQDYKAARRAYVADTKGATADDFDKMFGRDYVNPESYDVVGLAY